MKGKQHFQLYCRVDDRLTELRLPREVHEVHLAAIFSGFTSRITRRPPPPGWEVKSITSAELIPPPNHKDK